MKNGFDSSWFNLEHYELAKDFKSDEWYSQFQKRRFLMKWIKEDHSVAKGMIAKIKVNPLEGYKLFEVLKGAVKDATYEDFLVSNEHNTRTKELYHAIGLLLADDDTSDVNDSYGLSVHNARKVISLSTMLGQVISKTKPLVAIDLNVSDEQLLDDFRRWLKNKRTSGDNNRRSMMFTEKNFERWVRFQVLAYMDLKIIGLYEGEKLTYYNVGVLLFPDSLELDIDPTDRVKQSVKPLVDSLLMNESLSVLGGQRRKKDIKKL
ncbi:MAG TPA: hypothetical protein EYQ72_05950 [Gammaproteobacteria bacterium]|nr:hypothetical protein [Gammaproteobacteria bacterium]